MQTRRWLCTVVFALTFPVSTAAQVPRASEVVEPRAYVSLDKVPRGRVFEIAVVAKIRAGYHINAHEVSVSYLIPTEVSATLPPGFRLLSTSYPPGVLRQFKFAPEKLSVYEVTATLRLRLQAPADAPLGASQLPLILSYQACSYELCLPPVKLPLTAELEVAPADAQAHAVHSSLFAPQPKREPR